MNTIKSDCDFEKTKQQFGKETDENINEDEMVGVSAQNVMAKRLLAM